MSDEINLENYQFKRQEGATLQSHMLIDHQWLCHMINEIPSFDNGPDLTMEQLDAVLLAVEHDLWKRPESLEARLKPLAGIEDIEGFMRDVRENLRVLEIRNRPEHHSEHSQMNNHKLCEETLSLFPNKEPSENE